MLQARSSQKTTPSKFIAPSTKQSAALQERSSETTTPSKFIAPSTKQSAALQERSSETTTPSKFIAPAALVTQQQTYCIGCQTAFHSGQKLPNQSLNIEYKNFNFPLDNKNKWSLIRIITAFLNSRGGTIFIGIDDEACEVKGQIMPPKERDIFKLLVWELVDKLHPKVDLNRRQEVKVQFIPVYHGSEFKGRYVSKIIVLQGDCRNLYCFPQQLRIKIKSNQEIIETYHSFERHNMGGVKAIKGLQLIDQVKKRAQLPPSKPQAPSHNCNPEPRDLRKLTASYENLQANSQRQRAERDKHFPTIRVSQAPPQVQEDSETVPSPPKQFVAKSKSRQKESQSSLEGNQKRQSQYNSAINAPSLTSLRSQSPKKPSLTVKRLPNSLTITNLSTKSNRKLVHQLIQQQLDRLDLRPAVLVGQNSISMSFESYAKCKEVHSLFQNNLEQFNEYLGEKGLILDAPEVFNDGWAYRCAESDEFPEDDSNSFEDQSDQDDDIVTEIQKKSNKKRYYEKFEDDLGSDSDDSEEEGRGRNKKYVQKKNKSSSPPDRLVKKASSKKGRCPLPNNPKKSHYRQKEVQKPRYKQKYNQYQQQPPFSMAPFSMPPFSMPIKASKGKQYNPFGNDYLTPLMHELLPASTNQTNYIYIGHFNRQSKKEFVKQLRKFIKIEENCLHQHDVSILVEYENPITFAASLKKLKAVSKDLAVTFGFQEVLYISLASKSIFLQNFDKSKAKNLISYLNRQYYSSHLFKGAQISDKDSSRIDIMCRTEQKAASLLDKLTVDTALHEFKPQDSKYKMRFCMNTSTAL